MLTPPVGYASTSVWLRFTEWVSAHPKFREPSLPVEDWWAWRLFRDGYSAGVMEEDK